MGDFVHVFIHHEGEFVDNEFSSYEVLVSKVRCNVDKGSYFEVVGIKDVGTVLPGPHIWHVYFE